MAAVGLALVSPKQAQADELSTARYTVTHWQGPKRCRNQAHFEELLDQALGPEAEQAPAEALQLSVSISRRRGRFHLTLSTQNSLGKGERQLEAPRCEELLATAAVIVSLALQPDLLYVNENKGQVIKPQAHDDERPGAPWLHAQPSRKVAARQAYLRVALNLAAITDVGTLPRPAIGVSLVASAHSRHYRLAFRLTQWAEERRLISNYRANFGGNFNYISSTIDLCKDLLPGPKQAGACMLVGVGRLEGDSIEIDIPVAQAHLMANAGAAGFFELPLGRGARLRAQAELVAQLVRPNYSALVEDPEDKRRLVKVHIHQPAFAALRLLVSWGMTF